MDPVQALGITRHESLKKIRYVLGGGGEGRLVLGGSSRRERGTWLGRLLHHGDHNPPSPPGEPYWLTFSPAEGLKTRCSGFPGLSLPSPLSCFPSVLCGPQPSLLDHIRSPPLDLPLRQLH